MYARRINIKNMFAQKYFWIHKYRILLNDSGIDEIRCNVFMLSQYDINNMLVLKFHCEQEIWSGQS